MRKYRVLLALILVLFILPTSFSWHRRPSTPILLEPQSSTVVAEARDFATARFADPWDMNSIKDLGHRFKNMSGISVSNGIFTAKSTSTFPNFWLLWGGYPSAYPTVRDGIRNRISARYYKLLTFRMHLNSSTTATGSLSWFYGQHLVNPKTYSFKVYPGWHTYRLNLPSTTWKSSPMSLMFRPTNQSGITFKIDWVRLTNKPSATFNLQWEDSKTGDANIYFDTDNSDYNGVLLQSTYSSIGTNSLSVNTAGLQPGKYYFYMRKAGGNNSNYTVAPVIVNKAPTAKIVDPDEAGGRSWAAAVRRNAWDMRSRNDIRSAYNMAGKSFRGGIFSAYNSLRGPGNRKYDPYFLLNLGRKSLNTSVYHRLTFRYRFSGRYTLSRGTMGRFGWTAPGVNWQMTDDVVTYGGWNTYTIDLKKIKMNRGRRGWRGRINRIRFDPHEDRGTRRFYVDYITINADDQLRTSFPIRYWVADSNNSTVRVKIYRDRDQSFGNGNEALLRSVIQKPGRYSWRWRPSGRIRGKFWIYIQVADNRNSAGFYSSGPLKVH